MDTAYVPVKVLVYLLEDAARNDTAVARRLALVKILLDERFLDRQQLIVRVKTLLGGNCFGSAWDDVFYRDMRVVKEALSAAGYRLAYSRSAKHPGYYLARQPAVSEELSNVIRQSVAEIDPVQMQVLHAMPPARRFQIGCSVTDAARNAVSYRLRQQNPDLTPIQASYLALQGKASER